ncbi:axin-2 isoform X2 [Bombina bombina]|uniref:axin-2 isoform X2 n=1 Tax=Bombina bombina TaxID=8345 RepID=UPI00235A4C1B|nr:axin-2 isoform X2 [Bombina bombina]
MNRALLVNHLPDQSSSFRKDSPRPPVPGEEGKTSCQLPSSSAMKSQRSKPTSTSSHPRRNEDGLGEPEGSASPDSPLARWTKSLHSLLGDQDGAHLFRTFLEREKCVDTLDFWFACNGFRQMDLKDNKTPRVAKAIYKRYIENYGIVSKQLKLATKAYIKDSIKRQHIDSVMFDQAQTEVQTLMEENAYHMFLTSDIYLEYVRSGFENTAYFNNIGPGSLKVDSGYLPTLNEEEEWSCVDLKHRNLPSVVGLSSKALRVTASLRAKETVDSNYRSCKKNDLVNPYHINLGYVLAPTTSANESEISSDALTDDSMSMTDSSVDGIPPYRVGSKKQLQREMHRSVKANGQVSLPHFPRTHRLPKEMTPVDPAVFAAELISRLEKVKQEQETMDNLEERLQQIKEEEERDDCESPMCSQPSRESSITPHHPLILLPSCEDDPQAILDDHLSRVLKTPGCQSPGVGRHSPHTHSPDRSRPLRPTPQSVPPSIQCALLSKGFVTKQTTKHVHHHYIHHHTMPKTKEEIEAEAARRVQCFCSGSTEYCCYVKTKTHAKGLDVPLLHIEHGGSRTSTLSRRACKMAEYAGEGGVETVVYQVPTEEQMQTTWQRIVECENERQNKHKLHSLQCSKKTNAFESTRASSAERPTRHHTHGTSTCHPRNLQPSHSLVQDPTMSLPPNTLAQLEEACRRLAEVSKPPKQRCPASSHQRSHSLPSQAVSSPVTSISPGPEDHKEPKRQLNAPLASSSELMVTYFFCGEEIPYRRMLKSHSLTLGHFKEQLSKKGNYRYGARTIPV